MEYIITGPAHEAYSSDKSHRSVTLEDYIKSLSDLRTRKEFYYCVSSLLTPTQRWHQRLFRWFFYWVVGMEAKEPDLHCMLLDCDTEMGMIMACKVLEEDGIGTAVITSTKWRSEVRYWVICDLALPLREILHKMTTIPGVDEKYVKLCNLSKRIILRGLPRIAEDRKIQVPSFSDHSLKNPLVIQWHKDFRALFNNIDVQKAVKRRWLEGQFKEGKLKDHLADPEFEF